MALAGFTFGPYELLARLPSSAPTQTFLARQRGADSFKKLVCLRTLIPSLAKDESVVETFVAEAKLAAHLAHPACVTIYDLGRERGAYFVSMEYVTGETLESIVDASLAARDPLPGPLVASIIAAACDGLTFAHALRDPASGRGTGLVHGDLSPRNILVTYEGHTKILDFGIACAKAEHRGRQRYASPERVQGKPLDRRSDIYSLGLVLFEALAAKALGPISSEARTDWMPSVARAPKLSAIIPDVHPELEAICERALAPAREARYQSADELAEALRAYITKVGATDRRTAIVERMQKLFEQRSALRQRTLQKLLRGDCTEEELEADLGARSVADLGLLFGPEVEA
ncbi:serine/threonine protein kinase, partial [Myxococcota bacterium]|nr:serine/threonine protein kinase [Myxococcota bacterium]